jgi:hypothetical protein
MTSPCQLTTFSGAPSIPRLFAGWVGNIERQQAAQHSMCHPERSEGSAVALRFDRNNPGCPRSLAVGDLGDHEPPLPWVGDHKSSQEGL